MDMRACVMMRMNITMRNIRGQETIQEFSNFLHFRVRKNLAQRRRSAVNDRKGNTDHHRGGLNFPSPANWAGAMGIRL